MRGAAVTSYRAEGYELLSATRFIHRLHEYCQIPIKSTNITVICDKRIMVHQVANIIPSHQQRQLNAAQIPPKDGRAAQVTLKIAISEVIKVDADGLAAGYRQRYPTPQPHIPPFPHTHAHFHVQGSTITSKYAVVIRNAEREPKMIEYLKKRNGWSDEVFHRINWTAHEKAIRSQRHRARHITKLVQDILPTNPIQHWWNQSMTQGAHFVRQRRLKLEIIS